MLLTVHSFLEVPRMQHLKMQAAMHVLYLRKERVHMGMGERERERERSTRGDRVLFSSVGLWEGFLGVKIMGMGVPS